MNNQFIVKEEKQKITVKLKTVLRAFPPCYFRPIFMVFRNLLLVFHGFTSTVRNASDQGCSRIFNQVRVH